MSAGGVGTRKTNLCICPVVVRTIWNMIDMRIGVPFDWIVGRTIAVKVRQIYMSAASKQEGSNKNNISQFFFLSVVLISSKLSSGKVKY
tara:strand:+ start:41 stop:307 length:267 start_codon:yes stop_codon:yes gene_type:complete